MPLITIAPPGEEPVTVQEVKDAARIDDSAYDAQIPGIIRSLRRLVESNLGRRLVTQTVELVLPSFPRDEIDLQLPNVQTISSVKYLDPDGNQQTLATNRYLLLSDYSPSLLMPAMGSQWPATANRPDAVRIRFDAGYGAPADVPDEIKLWIKAHAVQAINNPDGLSDGNLKPLPYVDGLLDYYKIWRAV